MRSIKYLLTICRRSGSGVTGNPDTPWKEHTMFLQVRLRHVLSCVVFLLPHNLPTRRHCHQDIASSRIPEDSHGSCAEMQGKCPYVSEPFHPLPHQRELPSSLRTSIHFSMIRLVLVESEGSCLIPTYSEEAVWHGASSSPLSRWGHLDGFHFLAFTNKAAMSICAEAFVWMYVLFLLGVYVGVELLGQCQLDVCLSRELPDSFPQ